MHTQSLDEVVVEWGPQRACPPFCAPAEQDTSKIFASIVPTEVGSHPSMQKLEKEMHVWLDGPMEWFAVASERATYLCCKVHMVVGQ